MLGPPPLERVPAFRLVEMESVVQIAQLRGRFPGGESETISAYARELAGGRRMVGRENEAEAGADDVERLRRRTGAPPRLRARSRSGAPSPGRLQHPGRNVDSGDVGARGSRPNRHPARPGRHVEPGLARARLQARDQLVVHRPEPLRDSLVVADAPERGGPLRAQSCSFARVVSSLRARQSSGIHLVLDQLAEELDRRPLRADDLVPDHARDHLVMARAPDRDPLVPLDEQLGELVELLELAPALIQLDDRQTLGSAQLVEGLSELRRDAADVPETGRVEAAAVAEDGTDVARVLPRRHLLEHVQERVDDPHALDGAAEQADGRIRLPLLQQPRRLLHLRPAELQPQLRGLVDGLEEQLVAVRPLLRRLLQREQLVGAQVALVVGGRVALEDRLGVVLFDRHRGGWNRYSSYPSGSRTRTAAPQSSRIVSSTSTPAARRRAIASSTSSTSRFR